MQPARAPGGAGAPGAPGLPVTVTVIGEAVIDLVPGEQPAAYHAVLGGSAYNVAVGLARLGQRVALMARLSDAPFGRLLRDHAQAEGVDLAAAPHAAEPATLAVVSLDDRGQASYDFYFEGSADWQWTAEETGQAPQATAVFHFGSIASWTPPGDARILDLVQALRERGGVLVSYDPNVRPGLLGDHVSGQRVVERAVRLAHLAKASSDDIAWLYPDQPPGDVAGRWLGLGAGVAVITRGADGADVYTSGGITLHRPAPEVVVGDTVGAGDSFTAGLIASLVRRDLYAPDRLAGCPADQLAAALDDAILVAAVTCQRRGNDPPTLADLAAAR
ncbi:MAG TPA: carbohydrate kinase [Streptosporangiaceae bacterium]|nr:carbohydrate kinase [Streptosporangiaceae bacterium]